MAPQDGKQSRLRHVISRHHIAGERRGIFHTLSVLGAQTPTGE